MGHRPADVVPLALGEVVTHQEVAEVEDEREDDTDEGAASRGQDEEGCEDGGEGVLDVPADDEPAGQNPRHDEVEMLGRGGQPGHQPPVHQHHGVTQQLAQQQPGNRDTCIN